MAGQKQTKKKGNIRSALKKEKRNASVIFVLLGGLCLIFVVAVGVFYKKKSDLESPLPSINRQSPNSKHADTNTHQDFQNLIGRWIRTDGSYLIEIRNVETNGKMDAGYYNPRPINVALAEVSRTSTGAKVFVELQDTGYPGSTYTLFYDQDKDTLKGLYYQAVMKQHFDVIFARVK